MKEKWQRRMHTCRKGGQDYDSSYRQGVSNLHVATVPICLYRVVLK